MDENARKGEFRPEELRADLYLNQGIINLRMFKYEGAIELILKARKVSYSPGIFVLNHRFHGSRI